MLNVDASYNNLYSVFANYVSKWLFLEHFFKGYKIFENQKPTICYPISHIK